MDSVESLSPKVPARARFYFDNYKRIEEWAALRREAAAALHEQLVALTEQLQADTAGRENLLCRTADIDEGGYPRVILERPQWRHAGEASAPYGIALEWERTLIDRLGQVRLYVGVRGSTAHPRHDEVSAPVREAAAAWKRALPGTWNGNSAGWPCFTWIRPGDKIDEVDLLQRALDVQEDLLMRLAPDLDRLLAPTGGI